jgi:glucose/mannose-6-phosphate isomerase
MGVMARRWKGQWNENAKNWSFFDVMPELNHNAVVGFPHPDIAPDALAIVFLRSARDNPRVATRFDVTGQLLDRARIPHLELRFSGANALSEALQATYLGDLASFYVTLMNGEDPSPNTSIDYLKAELASVRTTAPRSLRRGSTDATAPPARSAASPISAGCSSPRTSPSSATAPCSS